MVSTALALVTIMGTIGCQNRPASPGNQATPPSTNAQPWEAFVEGFINSYFAAHPDVAVAAGRHEFDGKLPDWSPEGINREIERLRAERGRALNYSDAALNDQQRFERDYLVSRIDGDLFWLETAEWPYKNPFFYADPLDPDVYISREYAPLKDRLRAYVNYARAVPAAITQARSNLRLPLPRTYIKIGRTTLGGLASTYEKDVPQIFAPVEDQQLQAEFREANQAAIKAMKEFDAWLAAQQSQATDDFALGPEKFSRMLLATERVDMPLDKLEEIGQQDLERNLAALREACARFAPGETIERCIAKEQANKPAGSVVEEARNQLSGLKQFLIDKNLVSIPGTEEALVKEAPPYKRYNFAYINIPGPYEKGLPSIYYIAPPDPSWSRSQREEYIPGKADLLFTSVHEVWPGHFLQFLHANRAPSRFGQVFVGYAFAEGWAHYAEEMMWEAGLGDNSPETHIGQLLNALLRNVRFLSAIGMHTRGMSVAEAERMFREKGYQDAGNAQQQAERGTFDPAYLNYTMGKLMIKKLREDWTAARGGRAAWKEFHDQFLKYGGPPIPLVRAAMLGRHDSPF
jgi:uncharacterized protein (DUF885 family)